MMEMLINSLTVPRPSEASNLIMNSILPNALLNLSPSSSKRLRRRRPRSLAACLRRALPKKSGTPTDAAAGESATCVSMSLKATKPQPFFTYNIDIRCLLAYLGELCHHIAGCCPPVILVQESWLTKSVEEVNIPNYV